MVARLRPVIDGSHGASETRLIRAVENAEDEFPFREYVRRLLEHLGEDPDREGLVKTPARVELLYERLTRGYRTTVDEVVNSTAHQELAREASA